MGTFFACVNAWSQDEVRVELDSYVGKKIQNIEVVGGKRIEKDAVLAKIKSKKGDVVSRALLQSDVKSLFAMGYFEDIAIEGTNVDGGVQLTFRVRERQAIAKIEFDGNERLGDSDIQEVIKVKVWSILDFAKVREDLKLIQKLYEEKGYYLTKVDFEVRPVSGKQDEQVELIYKINDYDKVSIKRITFLNNKRYSDEKLKSLLAETKEGSLFSFISGSGSFKESAFKQDLQRLTIWYLENGFVKFRYDNPIVTVSDDKKWLYITVYVDEGEQYSMGSFDFSGDLLFPKEELKTELTLTEGQTFSISKRQADIQRLTEKYQDLGYAFVNVIPKMAIHDETKTVDMDYAFEKGNLVHFGEINIFGNSKTHDKVIRRELKIREGELYSGTNLRISRENVERLGFFQPGEVVFNTVTPKGKPDIVDIEITIKERSTGTITLGAGYGSVQGFFLTTQVAEINTFGLGLNTSLSGQFAKQNNAKSLNLGVTQPFFNDTNWVVGGDIFYVFFPIPQKYDTRKTGANVRLGYLIADYTNIFFTYKYEGINVLSPDSSIDPADVAADQGVLSSAVFSVVHDKRNNRFETTAGDYRSLSFEWAGLGGEKKFLKWILNNRFYRKVIGDLVFRNNIEYGQVYNLDDSHVVPPSERFYLGGPNNMRGYSLFSVGPRRFRTSSAGNPVNEPVGGTTQFYAISELEMPLIKEAGLKAVAFVDVGNTFYGFPAAKDIQLLSNWGIGFRWFSPIGPLRFEWGFPMRRRPGDDSQQFQFFIGPPF